MALSPAVRRVADDESGFTLVEMVVAMFAGILTLLALFTFQDVALRQSTMIFSRADATQEARTAIEKIEARLHSACVADGVTPILGSPGSVSNDTSLSVISEYGSGATLTPDKHVIALDGDTLTDSTHLVDGGSSPNWTFGPAQTNPPPSLLLDNVSAPAGQPIFSYYQYGVARDSTNAPYRDVAGNPFVMLLDGTSTLPSGVTTNNGGSVPAGTVPANSVPLATPLTAVTAANVAAVKINLVVRASGNLGNSTQNPNAPITVSDSVVLRITPVPSDDNQDTPPPCQ